MEQMWFLVFVAMLPIVIYLFYVAWHTLGMAEKSNALAHKAISLLDEQEVFISRVLAVNDILIRERNNPTQERKIIRRKNRNI